MDSERRQERIVERMRDRGCRITPQRLAIVHSLFTLGPEHPSIEPLYAAVKRDYPTTSQATVYKTVALLKEMGEVYEVRGADDAAHYEVIRQDAHAHAVCRECGCIVDFDLDHLDELMTEVATISEFASLDRMIQFSGVCRDCARAGSQETE